MECNKCKEQIVLHAFSTGRCESCNIEIVTSHIPCDRLCEECSTLLGMCKSCTVEMKEEEEEKEA